MSGDMRLFHLLWLMSVEDEDDDEALDADAREPMAGIGAPSEALGAFATFFGIDPDLVAAAAERAPHQDVTAPQAEAVIAALPDAEKLAWLTQAFEGAPHVTAGLRARMRELLGADGEAAAAGAMRSSGELRARAEALHLARQRAEAERAEAARRKAAAAQAAQRRARLDALARRGEAVWSEIGSEIERRSAQGYDKATQLLDDLKALAEERGQGTGFRTRLRSLLARHASKKRFIERWADMAQGVG
jgi:hypothetical protein